MSIGDTPITVVGNVVAEPELRFTPSGAAVANFRVASTPRVFNKNSSQYEDGEALFLTCNVWRQAAENVAESLSKGMRVIVNGRLKQRSYQTKEGENRTVFEIEVDEVGPSLKFVSAQVNRNSRDGGTSYQGGMGGFQGQQQTAQQGGFQGQQQTAQQGGFQGQQQTAQQGGFQGQQQTAQQGGFQGQQQTAQQGGFQGQQQTAQQGGFQGQQQTAQQGGDDPWGSAPAAGVGSGVGDEPPF